MYSNLQWLDHAVTPDRTFTMKANADGTVTLTPAGTVIQQGTNMSAANFNNIEMWTIVNKVDRRREKNQKSSSN